MPCSGRGAVTSKSTRSCDLVVTCLRSGVGPLEICDVVQRAPTQEEALPPMKAEDLQRAASSYKASGVGADD